MLTTMKLYGNEVTILLSDQRLDIGNSLTLSNGSYDEDFVAVGKSFDTISGKEYCRVTMVGSSTQTIKDVYYLREA